MYKNTNKIAFWMIIAVLILSFTPEGSAKLVAQDIQKLQEDLSARGATFIVGPNSATERDLSNLCGLVAPKDWWVGAPLMKKKPLRALPANWNWCDQEKCPPVRNQGSCGSCRNPKH